MDILDAASFEQAAKIQDEEEATANVDGHEEEEEEEEEEVSTGWGVWSALGINKEYVSRLAGEALGTLKRDIEEFKHAVASDTVTLGEAAELALPRAAATLQERVEDVGGSLEGYGHSLITGECIAAPS